MSKIYKINNHLMKYKNNCIDAIVPYKPSSVIIGTQTWMSTELDLDDGGEGIEKHTFTDYNGNSLGEMYYYTHDAAVRVANLIPGWHLPTREEWTTLINYIGENVYKLKSTDGWKNNGTNELGFNAKPYGEGRYDTDTYLFFNNYYLNDVKYFQCNYWSDTPMYGSLDNYSTYYSYKIDDYNTHILEYHMGIETKKENKFPIRLIKD